MNPDNVVFTTDENVDCIKHGDQCVELLGIITQIEAPKLVGQGDKKHKLMKFIVYNNNGNRNVQCLIWNHLIYTYENKIKANEIIHIDGETVKASSNLYKRSAVNLAPIEISIQDFTNVHFYGPYENEAADDEPIEISFSEIPNNTGRIKVCGYMKTIFQFMGKASDAARGTMCNETHKIIVRISNYTEIANLEKGSLIEVVGTIQHIAHPKIVFSFDVYNLTGVPDGMTIDSEDNLWVANHGGGHVIKINPKKGELLQTIDIPASRVTSVTFGDTLLDTLYVTTANFGLSMKEKGKQPDAGCVFAVKGLGVQGISPNKFKLRKF